MSLGALLLGCSGRGDVPSVAPVAITGAGATFPYPLYRAWFAEYGKRTNVRINYFSVGSGEGLRLLESGTADFGASDRPVPPAPDARPSSCARVAVPTVRGPIAVAYSVPQADSGTPLRFDAKLLAKIFAGRVTRWDDAAIKALNPHAALPSLVITPVHRGRGSGTSRIFGEYLATSAAWPYTPRDTGDVRWPAGITAEGNEGMAMEVKVRQGAIGYMELSYARQSRLQVASIGDRHRFHVPGASGDAYPIRARTWLVVDPVRTQPERGAALVEFIRWATHEGADQARALEYIPFTPDTIARYDSILRAIDFRACAATAAASATAAANAPAP